MNNSRKLLTQNQFITRSNIAHAGKYDYSQVKYVNTRTKVKIICPEHGEFFQNPSNHMRGGGCIKCAHEKVALKNSEGQRKSTADFIKEARKLHGDKYDYSQVKYVNTRTKVKIICPEHGVFEKTPHNHLKRFQSCPTCSVEEREQRFIDTRKERGESFIRRSVEVHGNKYDYSQVEYIGSHQKVKIICPEHGEFFQRPTSHVDHQAGCKQCYAEQTGRIWRVTTEDFIDRAKKIHGDKYDYSETRYESIHENLTIICPEHGRFEQRPSSHINKKSGCPRCAYEATQEALRIPCEEIIARFKEVHGNKYDYSEVDLNYKDTSTKVKITCPEHGEFFQRPQNHMRGVGCPECGNKYYRERWVREVLEDLYGVKFPNTKPTWLLSAKGGRMEIDCFNESLSLGVEYQGIQHYQPVKLWGGEEGFVKTTRRDRRKKALCDTNEVVLWRIDGRKFKRKLTEQEFKRQTMEILIKMSRDPTYTPPWLNLSSKLTLEE